MHIIPDSEIDGYKNSGFYQFKNIFKASEVILPDNFLSEADGHYIISSTNTSETFSKLKTHFKYIEAAGGLVFNDKNELLTIYRLEKYDLPKGKKETYEDIPTTAIREVEEECGVSNLKIIYQLPSTYHIYYLKNKYVLKQTYWFKMEAPNQPLTPQTEEEITEAKWMAPEQLDIFKANTYPTLLEILAYENL